MGDQHHPADSGRSRSTARLTDALDSKGCLFSCPRLCFEFANRRQLGIDQIEVRKIPRQKVCVSETSELVLRRYPRHGDGSFGQGGCVVIG